MEISQNVEIVQARVRVASRLDEQLGQAGTPDMFVDHAIAEADESRSEPRQVDQFWRDHLAEGERLVNEAAFADILELTSWLPKELQASLVRLIKAGEVVNLDALGKRRPVKPLHFHGKGERLRLTRTIDALE